MIRKNRLPLSGSTYIVLLAFLRNAPATLIAPILPLFIKNLVKEEAYVGYIFTITSLMLLISNFVVIKLLQKINKLNLFRISALISGISYLVLSVITNLYQFLILEIFRVLALVSGFMIVMLYIREYSSRKTIGKNEGLYYTTANLAWMIGPLIGGLIAEAYQFKTSFILAAVFPLIIFILLFIKPLKKDHTTVQTNTSFQNIKLFFKDKNLRKIYFIATGGVLWVISTYIYLPLFIRDNNFSISYIGYALFAMVIPLVLFEIPAGKLADKIGYRKVFFMGFALIALAALSIFFATPFMTIILIILASIGVAFVEPLRDAYFFAYIKKSDELKYIAPYVTHHEAASLIGPLILSSILLFAPFKIMFTIMGVFMLAFALLSLTLKEI